MEGLRDDAHPVAPALRRGLKERVTTADAERILMGYLGKNPAALVQHIRMAESMMKRQTEELLDMTLKDYGDLADPEANSERKTHDEEAT